MISQTHADQKITQCLFEIYLFAMENFFACKNSCKFNATKMKLYTICNYIPEEVEHVHMPYDNF